MTDHEAEAAPDGDGPTTLRLAVLILWIEAAALGLLTFIELYQLLTQDAASPGWGVSMVVTLAVAAVLAAMLGRWLVHRKAWARSPAIVQQLMALPVAYFMITGPASPAVRIGGALVGAVALFCAALLLAPASRSSLTIR